MSYANGGSTRGMCADRPMAHYQGILDAVSLFFRAFLSGGSQSVFEDLREDGRAYSSVTSVNLFLGVALTLRAGTFAAFVVGKPESHRNES